MMDRKQKFRVTDNIEHEIQSTGMNNEMVMVMLEGIVGVPVSRILFSNKQMDPSELAIGVFSEQESGVDYAFQIEQDVESVGSMELILRTEELNQN